MQVASGAAGGGDSDSKSESGASAASSNPTPPVSASPSRRGSKVATAEELVKQFGGRRTINKILIANNGIAGWFEKCLNSINIYRLTKFVRYYIMST